MTTPTDRIQHLVDSHWDTLYGRLCTDWENWWLPTGEILRASFDHSAIRLFEDAEAYARNELAHEFALHASDFDPGVYRTFFNEHTSQVYVDLHPRFASEYAPNETKTLGLASEILKSLLLADPALLRDEPDAAPAEVAVVVVP